MIRIRCDHNSKRRQRFRHTYQSCRGTFAFVPGDGDVLTDLAFQNATDSVSANGHLRWRIEHLYYEVCRRRRLWRPRVGSLIIISSITVGCFASYIFSTQTWIGYITIIAAGLLIIYALR